MSNFTYTRAFESLGLQDLEQVGGKNASLGEMISHLSELGVCVPSGFATTADAFRAFMHENQLELEIYDQLETLDIEDISALTRVGKAIRASIMGATFSNAFESALESAYEALEKKIGPKSFSVAVRSSATAEDLPDASFVGQQETFLNVEGFPAVLEAIKAVFASLFNDRAIAYRVHHGFSHRDVAISAGIQWMVRSDKACSGVLFTLDAESGFDKVVFITAAYGLGELVVQGAVNPDEYYLYKPNILSQKPAVLRKHLGAKAIQMIYSEVPGEKVKVVDTPLEHRLKFALNEKELAFLAEQALHIEKHYGRPMDIEWAKDGITGQICILQARPETVKSRESHHTMERYTLLEQGTVLCEGRAIGQRIGSGRARIIHDLSEMAKLEPGDVLISDMTDPDWEPIMKRAAVIVTNRGGRTCHAAIIARELGIPAVVGCGDATDSLKEGGWVTVSCAEGDAGFVYDGKLNFEHTHSDVHALPELSMKVMMNVGNPERAFSFQSIPNAGVGLARLEFLISSHIGIHPQALLNFESIQNPELKKQIQEKVTAYEDPVDYYVQRLKEGIATIAAAFSPKPVIVRLSDFKSNEYANLIGGELFEPQEENPMLGFRGAARYISPQFEPCFALECQAVKLVRENMGLDNVQVMIPFVRTTKEASAVVEKLGHYGLTRGERGLKLIMMCELPSNALLAEAFLQYFDGFSIGSNDLTQLTLGLDRDSGTVASQFDERDPAVLFLIERAIQACKASGKYIGICGQGPSDHPDLAAWLYKKGIDSVSLNPDTVLETTLFLADQHAQP